MNKTITIAILCLMTIGAFAQSTNTYEYDNLNRLTKVTYANGAVVQYTYDAVGNRLSKTVAGVYGQYTITASASPSNSGTITGTGIYQSGNTCTLTAIANSGYSFISWTENGIQVSTNAIYSFNVTDNRALVANFSMIGNENGRLNGVFSISDNLQVNFSQGNLQYQASSNTWRFASNQYDIIGWDNGNISETYTGWIDLFGWGTSGYNHGASCYQPWSNSTTNNDYYAYGAFYNNLYEFSGQADWGYNAISNGGNQENYWRTLTTEEWTYLFNTRITSSGIRFAKAEVDGHYGMILLPDNWDASIYSLNNPNIGNANYSGNIIDPSVWANTLEANGAVFLPATGYRNGNSVSGPGAYGNYWSTTFGNSNRGKRVYFNESDLRCSDNIVRYGGLGVRLVAPVEGTIFTINVLSNNITYGTVQGNGTYLNGVTCTINITPNDGYTFINWTEDGKEVSTEPYYSFVAKRDRNIVANFTCANGDGKLNGVFSVGENSQVNFSQGNLQYKASTNTWRFATNQYDHVGWDNVKISETYNGWIDLFGWGTSGYNHGAVCYQPWSTSTNKADYYAYGAYTYNLNDQTGLADWGYNVISNGGNSENYGWRTLTNNEWEYVFNTRTTASGIRFAKAHVNGINGVILLPDNWNSSTFSLSNINESDASFASNAITLTEWANTFEANGAVFLPAAGYRDEGTSINDVGTDGYYWSSVCQSNVYCKCICFYNTYLSPTTYYYRFDGLSVRLVTPVLTYSINATSSPAEGGIVSGYGTYLYGSTATLTATANEGYEFVKWTENGEAVSYNPVYSFEVSSDRELVANFRHLGSHWTPIGGTQYNMTISGIILINGEEQAATTLEVGAFCGDECRGSMTAEFFPPTQQYVVSLTVVSNQQSGETITFRLYDQVEGQELDLLCTNSITFESNAIIGGVGNWYQFDFSDEVVITATVNPEGAGSVTGAGSYMPGTTATLAATANSGYAFREWTVNGETVSTDNPYSFTVTGATNLVAQFDLQQTSNLPDGWSWWSTYIEMNGNNGLQQMEQSLGHNGLMIKTQTPYVQNYYPTLGYDYWFGSLTNVGLTNEAGYQISVSSSCQAVVAGAVAEAAAHPITVRSGWNWIGYPVMAQQGLSTALANFTPAANDLIKGQNSSATYYDNYGWFPTSFTLAPGQGYMYLSNATENKTLTYAVGRCDSEIVKSEERVWTNDEHAFADNLTVIAVVSIDGEEQQNNELELGAFVDGECRGSAVLEHFELTDRWYAVMTVAGVKGEEINFAIVNRRKGKTNAGSANRVVFVENAVVGSLDKPYEVNFTANGALKLYPNPVERNEAYMLDIPSEEEVVEVFVFSALGEMVSHMEGAQASQRMQGMAVAGVYTVKAVCRSGNTYIERLIVK